MTGSELSLPFVNSIDRIDQTSDLGYIHIFTLLETKEEADFQFPDFIKQ